MKPPTKNIINIYQLQICITAFLVGITISGCTFLGVPWQLSAANTAGDIISSQQTGKTLSENAASSALQRDCQWSRVVLGWAPCLTNDELVDNLIDMGCKTYSWNFLNIPYCREIK